MPFLELEVSSVTTSHPTVTIISPTPRAFQFPINVNDPYASPSSSPFEPDLKALSLSLTPPPPRPLSPTSSINSDSSSLPSPTSTIHLSPQHTRQAQPPALPKRRKSLGADPVERRPRKGDEDYIKRPENAFILFRRKCCEERNGVEGSEDSGLAAPAKKQRQADLSKLISQQWKSLTPDEKQRWEDLAKEKKKEHEQMYPNYVYRPQRSKASKGKKSKGRKALTEGEQDTDPETYSCLLPVSLPSSSSSSSNRQGRARSAPTPPLTYQTIHIPTVYMPSCPPSPALRSQRTPLPKHTLDRNAPARMTYIPDDTLMPQPFSQSPYDPQLEVRLLPPSSLIPITHSFLSEQRNVPGYVRPARTECASQQEQLAVITLDPSDGFYPLARQPRVLRFLRSYVSFITRGWSLLSYRWLPPRPVTRWCSRLRSPSRRKLLQPIVHGLPFIQLG